MRSSKRRDEKTAGNLSPDHAQKRRDKNKIYSVHEPHVECISKGKAHKRYEFGVKVSVATTSRGGWFVGAWACHGNPYDGHTLAESIEQMERIAGKKTESVFVDRGYRGHDYGEEISVHVDKVRRGRTAKSLWKWMKRRAAVEPSIGHLKSGHRLGRNYLAGKDGDSLNAVLSAAGMNFGKLLKHAAVFLSLLFFWRKIFTSGANNGLLCRNSVICLGV
jgi:IS5 family transposase